VASLPRDGVQGWHWAWARAVGAWPAAEAPGAEVLAVPEDLRETWAERVAIMWGG
jgi:hypothetical protein